MFAPNYAYKTIKEAQLELLKTLLENGEEVENLIEVNNISVLIKEPLTESDELFDDITKIGKKHLSQMLLQPDPNLEKTHHSRLHNFLVGKSSEVGEDVVSYDQIKEIILRLKENPFSKRCVITLWQPHDTTDPYALSWVFSQLMIRNGKLIMTNFFRGCDIYNAFTFNMLGIAMLQSDIATELGIQTGDFIVHIGSAHIYKIHIKEIDEYLANV